MYCSFNRNIKSKSTTFKYSVLPFHSYTKSNPIIAGYSRMGIPMISVRLRIINLCKSTIKPSHPAKEAWDPHQANDRLG